VSESIEATVPETVRETVEKLKLLYDDEGEPVTISAVAKELRLDKAAAWRRVRSAMDRGFIRNLEDRKGRAAQLVPGDDLPDDIEILPSPEALQGCAVAVVSEGVEDPPPPSAGERDHPLDCECDDCLYPTPKYAKSRGMP
jgi:hypothetical protein